MLVGASGAVGPPALAKFDFALVEVLFELRPFVASRGPVLLDRSQCSPSREVRLVVADHVFEDSDVASRRLDVQVPE